jgi:transcription termination factor Rho
MAVLERSDLEASPLADLHAIANQIGLDGFRRLRKAELIDAILGEPAGSSAVPAETDAEQDETDSEQGEDERPARSRRRRPTRARRSGADAEEIQTAAPAPDEESEPAEAPARSGARRGRGRGTRGAAGGAPSERAERIEVDSEPGGRVASGVVEVLGNGSAFLRVDPPEPSDEDIYISAAQVRRCELVSGDTVTGPVRTPRRSERYPSMVRIDTINGASADTVADGGRYEDLPVAWPSERLALDSKDPTLEAIEWLTPLGRGSRAVLVGPSYSGKTETLRRLLAAVSGREGLEVSVVLAGVRPEEIQDWQDGPLAPVAAVSFTASADAQGQAVERAIDAARRTATRGGDALVLIDGLDGLNPHAARKALAAARNLREGGSLTVIATAAEPLGGETTVIALDRRLTATGRQPILDLARSGTLRLELLVGEDGAAAVTKARAAAIEA